MTNPMRWVTVICLGALLGALAGLLVFPAALQRVISPPLPKVMGEAAVGGPFRLISHRGAQVSDRDFLGAPLLMFFGHTRSPDVTPAALQVMAAALARIGRRAAQVPALLVTLDPDFDTPERLAAYFSARDQRFVGLTGDAGAIAELARAYRVHPTIQRAADGSIEIDSAGLIHLVDGQGRYVAHFSFAAAPKDVAEQLSLVLP